MIKIPSLFKRDYDTHLVYDEVVEGSEWVQLGEGEATIKFDGTACLIQDGKLYKRYDAKHGKKPPDNFTPAQDEPDEITGHWPGWVPVNESDKWHNEAFEHAKETKLCDNGTYELVGPKIQSNPEGLIAHILIRHGVIALASAPRTFNELKEWFVDKYIEGIVWHHPDGRMVKIKKKDFGLKR
jgi:hypothetical protein